MFEQTEKSIDKVIRQARNGLIEIGDDENGVWKFYIKFYTRENGVFNSEKREDKISIIEIPDKNLFVEKADQYLQVAKIIYSEDKDYFMLNDSAFEEKLFLDLVVNATNFDLNNFVPYVENRTQMLENEFKTQKSLICKFEDMEMWCAVGKNFSHLEAPYKFECAFFDKNLNKFKLPSITFGVVGNTVYNYAIQGKKEKQDNALAKKLDRFFRKANKGVDPEDIISKVSPNAIVALTVFLAIMKKAGIENVKAPCFMPLRYEGNKISGYYKSKTRQESREFLEQHNRNQYNITNKFMSTYMRYNFHFDGCRVDFDVDKEEMSMTLTDKNSESDNILNEIDKLVCDSYCNVLTPIDKEKTKKNK